MSFMEYPLYKIKNLKNNNNLNSMYFLNRKKRLNR